MNAAGGKLWLCLVDGDSALETEPGYLELRSGPDAGYAIAAFRDECVHTLTALSPERVVILDMESSARGAAGAAMRTRIAGETLLALCAVDAGVPCVRLARPTLRARLGLPRAGSVADHVTCVFDTPVGPRWTNKRDLAALAARAEIVGG